MGKKLELEKVRIGGGGEEVERKKGVSIGSIRYLGDNFYKARYWE